MKNLFLASLFLTISAASASDCTKIYEEARSLHEAALNTVGVSNDKLSKSISAGTDDEYCELLKESKVAAIQALKQLPVIKKAFKSAEKVCPKPNDIADFLDVQPYLIQHLRDQLKTIARNSDGLCE